MNQKSLIALLVASAAFAAGCTSSKNDNGTPPADAPAVYSLSPAIGSTAGGTTVTLSGANFQSGATVTFDGVNATSVSVASAWQITATAPSNAAAKFVDVCVVNPDSQAATRSGAYLYCFANPTSNAQIINSCPPAGVQTVNKDDSAVQPYLQAGNLPPLN